MIQLYMPHFKFPCHYVYWSQVDDHENIKSNVLPVIRKLESEIGDNETFKASNVNTNFLKQNNFLDDKMVYEIVWKNLEKMITETDCFTIKPDDCVLTQYWFNTYETNNFQEMHQHIGLPSIIDGKRYDHTFSIIYILHSEEEKNSTIFKLEEPTIPFHPMLKKIEFNTANVDEIKEGTVLIFSNILNHAVLPVKVPGRVTFAFNVACSFFG